MIRKPNSILAFLITVFAIAWLMLAASAVQAQPEAPAFSTDDGYPSTNIPVLATGELRVTTTTLEGTVSTSGTVILLPRNVDLSSPTKTFDVSGANFFILSSDANQTAVVPTGGTLWQKIYLMSNEIGSNTMTLTDGTSTTLGSNFVLTEGERDWIELICVDPDGDEWLGGGRGQN